MKRLYGPYRLQAGLLLVVMELKVYHSAHSRIPNHIGCLQQLVRVDVKHRKQLYDTYSLQGRLL